VGEVTRRFPTWRRHRFGGRRGRVSLRVVLHGGSGRTERNGGGGTSRRSRRPTASRGAARHRTRAQGGVLGAGNGMLIWGSELQRWNSIRPQAWLTDGSSSMATQRQRRRTAPSNQETPRCTRLTDTSTCGYYSSIPLARGLAPKATQWQAA
jgi:hypothetical protein